MSVSYLEKNTGEGVDPPRPPAYPDELKVFYCLHISIYHCTTFMCIAHIYILENEFSFSHKLWFYNPSILETPCRRLQIFQTIDSFGSNNLSLNYQRFEFVTITQFFYLYLTWNQ